MVGLKSISGRVKGYSTIFLSIILTVVLLSCLVFVEYASGCAAASIAENVLAISGRSVLSEYQNELYHRYGLFALKAPDSFIKEKALFYLKSSLENKRGIVKLKVESLDVDSGEDGFTDDEMERQIKCLSLGINDYILHYFSRMDEQSDDTELKLETEYVICGKESDEENKRGIRNRIFESRFAVDLAQIYADKVQMAEIESIAVLAVPGVGSQAAVLAIASERAAVKANRETDIIMDGGNVPIINIDGLESYGSYSEYLRAFLLLVPRSTRLQRIRDIMERNISNVDGVDFSFADCVCGFSLRADFSKRSSAYLFGINRRYKTIEKAFSYK